MDLFYRVSKKAKKEKQATIDLNQMMYWWTRKPLIVGRAIALTTILDKQTDIEQFAGLESDKPYEYVPNVANLTKKLGMDLNKISVYDPFGGSGNLMFPVVQLGLNVTISDYNPLAWLIERAALEFPAKYGLALQRDFSDCAEEAVEMTEKEVGKYFKKSCLTYLWCWCIRCPYCSQRFPLTNHMYIEDTNKRKIGIKIIPEKKDFAIKLIDGISAVDAEKYTQKHGKAVCISCTNTIQRDKIEKDLMEYKDREMIAIQVRTAKGRSYVLPNDEDKKLYSDAIATFNEKRHEFESDNLLPTEQILPSQGVKNTLWSCGINTWDQYFDERQLLVLCTLIKNLKKVCKMIPNKQKRSIIATYLSFVLAKRIDMAGLGVIWSKTRTMPIHLLTMRRPSIAYNFAESNPFVNVGGSLPNIVRSVARAIKFASRLPSGVTCINASATRSSNEKYDIIITDPPYGDDVQYGELSEFFYVWVYRVLSEYYSLPPRISLDEDYCESRGRFGDKKRAKEFFGAGLKKTFKATAKKLKDDGLFVVLFAHSSTEAWNQLLLALREAKLCIVSSYVVHTELATNVLARNKTSFQSSIIVTCRKINGESIQFFEDLIPAIEDSVKKVIDDIPSDRIIELPMTDLLTMVYGKVLEVSTQHTLLKSYTKDFKPNFETLIKKARLFIIKHLVEKVLEKQSGTIGSDMSFYIFIKVFNGGQVMADEALKIAQVYNTSIETLTNKGLVIQKGGEVYLRSLKRTIDSEPDSVDPNNLYDQLCYLASHKSSIKDVLFHENIKVNDLRSIISLLIKSYKLQRNRGLDFTNESVEEESILANIADHIGVNDESQLRLGT